MRSMKTVSSVGSVTERSVTVKPPRSAARDDARAARPRCRAPQAHGAVDALGVADAGHLFGEDAGQRVEVAVGRDGHEGVGAGRRA